MADAAAERTKTMTKQAKALVTRIRSQMIIDRECENCGAQDVDSRLARLNGNRRRPLEALCPLCRGDY